MPKTWLEKFSSKKVPEIKIIDKQFADLQPNTKMLISSPKQIDAYINTIPFGHQVSTKQMRFDLANQNDAENTCPVTTGIFLRIVAEVATENLDKKVKITPFWRVIHHDSDLAKKLSCGVDFIKKQRALENLL